jgi:ubiquinone/menaquinone biosynthesis C-methylase UbiE
MGTSAEHKLLIDINPEAISRGKSDYDNRDVDYALIHGESKAVYARFVEALHLTEGCRLLDMGGGYGSVLLNIIDNQPEIRFRYDLLDSSVGQLQKAAEKIEDFLREKRTSVTVNFIHQDAATMGLPPADYDVVVCKLFIHEIPQDLQEITFRKIYDVLKPGGMVIFWTPDLGADDYDFYTSTIQKKDELASYDALARNRHFLLNDELVRYLEEGGFFSVAKLFSFDYDLHTSLRLYMEFRGEVAKLAEWHRHIIESAGRLHPAVRMRLLVDVQQGNIHLRFRRVVYRAYK